jgi:hypothetical protein
MRVYGNLFSLVAHTLKQTSHKDITETAASQVKYGTEVSQVSHFCQLGLVFDFTNCNNSGCCAIKIATITWRHRRQVQTPLSPSRSVSWLGWLVAGLLPGWPGIDLRPVHVGFVMDRVPLEQVFLRVRWFYSVPFHHCSIIIFHSSATDTNITFAPNATLSLCLWVHTVNKRMPEFGAFPHWHLDLFRR